MALCIKKGVAIVALFSSLSASADWFEDLARTPKYKLHVPPVFLDHLLKPPPQIEQEREFNIVFPDISSSMGKPSKGRDLKACRQQNGEWGFCDT